MVGFPKVIKTKADLTNTFKLVQKGRLKAADWLAAVEKLENQNYIFCPILEKSEDRKVITLMFVNEVTEGGKVKTGSTTAAVNGVEHIEIPAAAVQTDTEAAADQTESRADEAAASASSNQTKHTILTLSKAVAASLEAIGVPAAVTFYDRLGITEAEVEAMKGALV